MTYLFILCLGAFEQTFDLGDLKVIFNWETFYSRHNSLFLWLRACQTMLGDACMHRSEHTHYWQEL